jgi:hypothetical protein
MVRALFPAPDPSGTVWTEFLNRTCVLPQGGTARRREVTMNIRKLGMTAIVAGAMGAAAFGLGAGTAQADPDVWVPVPGIPGVDIVNVPPGHFGQAVGVPPGQLKKIPWTPLYGTPPGHW